MRSSSLTAIFFHLSSLVITIIADATSARDDANSGMNRLDFPPGFAFGAGSSAYQVEGAAAEDGRKPSIWDTYAHAGKIADKSTGDIASDQYHKYKEDVKLMYEMGLDAYKFSISWPRLIPDGHGDVNPKGLDYYNNLINELLSFLIIHSVSYFLIGITFQKFTSFSWEINSFASICFSYRETENLPQKMLEISYQTIIMHISMIQRRTTNTSSRRWWMASYYRSVHGDINSEFNWAYIFILLSFIGLHSQLRRIEPHVTLNQFDIPQALQDEYAGYISRKFIGDFTAYADVCFKEYGDRVKYWTTFSEPNVQTIMGNDVGIIPPERCSYPFGVNCSNGGDSTTEPYLATHNILLSHAAASHLYRTKYQEKQRGQIGITLLAFWLEPMTDSPRDVSATQRVLDFHLGWYLDPIVYGNYPATMRKIVGSRLPVFTENELKLLKGSLDFIGLNHYSVMNVQDFPRTLDKYDRDFMVDISAKVDPMELNTMEFTRLKTDGMLIIPWGLQRLLEYVKLKYQNPAVFIHENGYLTTIDDSSNGTARNDTRRMEYLQSYIKSLLLSISVVAV